MTVLVLGASGWLGSRVATAFEERSPVLRVVRRSVGGHDSGLLVDPDWVDDWSRVVDRALRERADTVVAALAGWAEDGQVSSAPISLLDARLASHLRPHFAAVRIAHDLALAGGRRVRLISVNGNASRTPLDGAGLVSTTGAAQRMLLDVARAEARGTRLEITEFVIGAAIAQDSRNPTEEGDAMVSLPVVIDGITAIATLPSAAPAVYCV